MVALGLWVEIGVFVGCLWWCTPWWLLGFVCFLLILCALS